MVKIRKKLLDLSSIGIADIIGSGISALFWFYVASTMGPEGYGQITYFLSIAMLASGISLLGAAPTIMVYTAKNVKIQPALYVMTLAASSIASIIVFFIFFNVGISSLILGYVIFSLISSELLGRKLYRKYSKFVLTQKGLMVGFALGFYYLLGDEGILIGIALSFSPYIYGIVSGFRKAKVDFSLVRERIEFVRNSFFHTLTGTLSESLDKLLIAPLLGFVILGNYSLSLQFLGLLMIIPTVVSKYLIPEISAGIENKKLKKIIILFSIGVAILGFTVGPTLLSIVFPKFPEAAEVIQIISWAAIPNTVTIVYYSKFWATEKNRKVLFGSIINIITLIIGIIILGSLYNVNGVAVALVLASGASAIYAAISDNLEKWR